MVALFALVCTGLIGLSRSEFVSSAPPPTGEPAKCEIPWPTFGRWTDCIPETFKTQGEKCTFEKPFGMDCTYPSGPLECNRGGKFETYDENGKSNGPNMCTLIPRPKDGLGCARHDQNSDECTSTEGCHWDGERSWCGLNCRKVGCGVELHRRDVQCMFNCPLRNATECTSWQAGCACIQDSNIKDCATWCQTTNEELFTWLPTHQTAANSYQSTNAVRAKLLKVSESFNEKNDELYDPIQLCKDACSQRGMCISPKVQV